MPTGSPPLALASASAAKRAGRAIATLPGAQRRRRRASLAHIARHALSHPVCIDVTAEDTMSLLMDAVRAGMDS